MTAPAEGPAGAGPGDGALDAVVFDWATLVEAPTPSGGGAPAARPGARRLLAALIQRGVAVRVVAPTPARGAPLEPDLVAAQLDAAGLPVAGGVVAADRATLGIAGDRGLAVSRAAEPRSDAASPALPAVTADDGRPVHRAVFEWLAPRMGAFRAAALLHAPLDARTQQAAHEHHLRLTKPPGSLGRLEAVGAQLAGIAAVMPPPLPRPAAVAVFAGDHGVHAQGVSPWPQEVTAQMVGNFLAGGAAINVLARQAGADVVVVDVGVASELPEAPGLLRRKVRPGTADLTVGPAMSTDDVRQALDVGAEVAAHLFDRGARCLVTGDMGIANTTPSSALIAALTGRAAPAVTGRGAGLDDDLFRRKTALVAAAASRARHLHGDDTLAILGEIGGLEHAALAGFLVGASALQVPAVVDGVIAAAALLVASRLVPGVEHGVIAGHRSIEPGASAVLGVLGLGPMVDLGLRLGEGTGAALALPLVEAAARVLAEMATFDQAGVTGK
jgi:nicotinate-nucleotide--dimethylbenzimidazole phosphoribosyltransferase